MSIFKEDSNSDFVTSSNRKSKIWAIGGGKGGVGKSLVTANTSICLALMGYKVITIDLDLGGANIHTCLGIPIPQKTLSDFITKKVDTLEQLIVDTPIPNLKVISGAQDELEIANLKQAQKSKILSALSKLDADYILLDLGAGTTNNTLDFFIAADKGILVILPEPTSIENTYRFIKSVYNRKLKMIEDLFDIQPLINQAMNTKIGNTASTPADLINKIMQLNPAMGQKVKSQLDQFNPQIVMNQVRSQNDIDIGFSIKSVSKRYFGLDMTYAGYLDYDPTVWQSVKKKRPLLMEFPNSPLVKNFEKIVLKLLDIN